MGGSERPPSPPLVRKRLGEAVPLLCLAPCRLLCLAPCPHHRDNARWALASLTAVGGTEMFGRPVRDTPFVSQHDMFVARYMTPQTGHDFRYLLA